MDNASKEKTSRKEKEKVACPVCLRHGATIDSLYGVLPCAECSQRRSTQRSPDRQVEFTSDRIKTERKQFAKDILQPFRSGEPSREFLEAHPNKAKRYFTKKELRTAKKVWKGI